MRFHVGQLVMAVQDTRHLDQIGKCGRVLEVGIPCCKPFVPGQKVPGLLVDMDEKGPMQGAYACWAPLDNPGLPGCEVTDEELPEVLHA